jgi:hypothetical protein
MKIIERAFSSPEIPNENQEFGTEQEKLVALVKGALLYNLKGVDCDEIVLEFCSKVGESYPKSKKERESLVAKLSDPAFLTTIENLTTADLRPHKEELNDMVSVTYENPEVVLLHVSPVNEASTSSKLEMFKDGLAKLASLLKTDPKLATVKTVGALSWIVSEHPRILEKFGFTLGPLDAVLSGKSIDQKYRDMKEHFPTFIPPNYRKTEMGFASVSKDDFLRRYDS